MKSYRGSLGIRAGCPTIAGRLPLIPLSLLKVKEKKESFFSSLVLFFVYVVITDHVTSAELFSPLYQSLFLFFICSYVQIVFIRSQKHC